MKKKKRYFKKSYKSSKKSKSLYEVIKFKKTRKKKLKKCKKNNKNLSDYDRGFSYNRSSPRGMKPFMTIERKSSLDGFKHLSDTYGQIQESKAIKRHLDTEKEIAEIKRKQQSDLMFHISMETAGMDPKTKLEFIRAYSGMMNFDTINDNTNNYVH
jgi:hypothetical protein